MKPRPKDDAALTVRLLSEIVRLYEENPALRLKKGVDLLQLEGVRRVRRQLLKQAR